MAAKPSGGQAQHTFRQFAWNLAGTLATAKSGARPAQPTAGAGAGP